MNFFLIRNRTARMIVYGITTAVVILILAICFAFSQLISDAEYIIVTKTPLDVLTSEYMTYVSQGGTWVLDSADLNAIAHIIVKEGTKVGSLTIQSLFVELNGDEFNILSFIKGYGFETVIKSELVITFDEQYVVIQQKSIKVGNISLPVKFVFDYAKQHSNQFEFSDDGVKISKDELPSKLVSFNAINSSLSLVWAEPIILEPEEPNDGVPENPVNIPSPMETVKNLLISTNKQLVTVQSKTSTQAEKDLINLIRNSISNVINDPHYDITNDVIIVKLDYSKLTSEERSELKTLILTHMSTKNLLKLKEMFNL